MALKSEEEAAEEHGHRDRGDRQTQTHELPERDSYMHLLRGVHEDEVAHGAEKGDVAGEGAAGREGDPNYRDSAPVPQGFQHGDLERDPGDVAHDLRAAQGRPDDGEKRTGRMARSRYRHEPREGADDAPLNGALDHHEQAREQEEDRPVQPRERRSATRGDEKEDDGTGERDLPDRDDRTVPEGGRDVQRHQDNHRTRKRAEHGVLSQPGAPAALRK